REARRAKGRFGLLTGTVTVPVFPVVFQQAVLDGLVTEFVGAIRNQSADVLVYGEDARLNLQGSVVPPVAPEQVAAVEGVARAEPLGVAAVTVEAGGELEDATLFGHVLDGPGAPVEIEEGRRPERDGEAVASASAADDGFGVGDVVVVQPGGERIEIVGTARETSFSVTPTLFASYATYEAVLLSVNPDAPAVVPSAVAVEVEDGADPSAVAERITAEVEGVEAATRDRAADDAPGVQSVSQSLSIVLLLTYVVVTIVTGFFFLILTVQKQPTLTLLPALRAAARSLVAALGLQVLLVVGGAAGCVWAARAVRGRRGVGGGSGLGAALAEVVLRVDRVGIEAGVAAAGMVRTAAAELLFAALACLGAARRIPRLDPAWAPL